MLSNYTKYTPKHDLGIKQPKKYRVRKIIEKLRHHNSPCRQITAPNYATKYQPEFLEAFRELCEIYASSKFKNPELQVLLLLLDNQIQPCRAYSFNREIVLRLAGGRFK
jgi:hypothetical protein